MRAPTVGARRRVTRVLLGLLVAGLFVGPARSSDAQTEPAALGGFQGTAAASGLHAFYNPEGLLPISAPVDLGAPDALSTISSGPQTFARASVADPGDLLANPGAFLAQASAAYPAGLIPEYPFRVTASSGLGAPSAESNPAPGLNARVTADDAGSVALATMPAVNAPAIANVGSMSARTTTATDGSSVTVTARSQISGFNLLGLVTIDSVVTELQATSDGTETTFTGGTKVVGATVFGQAVTIDADGIHQGNGSSTLLGGVLGQLTGSLNDVLAAVGVRISVAGPVDLASASAGQLGSTGLRIDLELSPQTLPALATLVDALPPIENPLPGVPSLEDVLAVAQARHLVSVELGRGLVALAARPGATFDTSTPSTSGSVDFPSVTPGFELPGTSLTPTAPEGSAAPELTSDSPELPDGAGVGALILLALLAHPFLGELLARVSGAVLAPNRSESCSWEER